MAFLRKYCQAVFDLFVKAVFGCPVLCFVAGMTSRAVASGKIKEEYYEKGVVLWLVEGN